MGARTPYRKGSPHIVCPLFSSAALLIRSFTAEYLAKGNLDILEGVVGQKTKERQLIQTNSHMGRKKAKDMRCHKKEKQVLQKEVNSEM